MDEIYLIVRGPLALISFIIFLLGTIYQIVWFFKNTKRKEITKYKIFIPKQEIERLTPSIEIRNLAKWEGSAWSSDPVFTLITSIFHILVIITPIFLLSHNILIKESWGIHIPSFSEKLSDIYTLIVLVFGIYFLYRRIFNKKVNLITNFIDYCTLVLVFLPYLTGFLAYHQIFPYQYMIIIHMLAGELMIILIPFSKLRHLIFFFLNRFFIQSEYSFFKKGNRVWI